MIKKCLSWAIFFCLLSGGQVYSKQGSEMEVSRKYLVHSDTYYWLSREKNNAPVEIEKNIFYAKKALAILDTLPKSHATELMKLQGKNSINEAIEQMDRGSGSLNNFSPLFVLLNGQNSIYETSADAKEATIEKSIERFVGEGPNFSFKLFMIVLAENKNLKVEEVAHSYLNRHSSYYVITMHELASFLTAEEMEMLYESTIPSEILNKISKNFSTPGVGILRINNSDIVDNIFYWTSYFNFWDSAKNSFERSSRADAFGETFSGYSSLIFLLIILGFPATFLFNKLNKDSKGNFAPLWLSPLAALFSIIILVMVFKGISLLNIDGSLPILSPYGIFWLASLILLLALLPPLTAYISSIRIPQVGSILNNPETVSSILFGTYLGSLTYLAFFASIRLNPQTSLLIAIPAIFCSWVVSLRFGKAYHSNVVKNESASGIEYTLLLISLCLYMGAVITWNFKIFWISTACLAGFSIMSAFAPRLILNFLKKISEKVGQNDNYEGLTGIAWLKRELLNPKFVKASLADIFNEAKEFITSNDDGKIEVVFIEADVGCGKTRMATELAKDVEKNYAEKGYKAVILFGDCNDSQDLDIVPYEPFAQALGDFLGVNRFSSPSEKAEKLKKGLVGKGLKTAMSLAGAGALGTLLDTEDDGKTKKSSTREMAGVVAEALTELSRDTGDKKAKVIFIIDDTQWIDLSTFELLDLLFQILTTNFKDNEVSFIFTSRKVTDDDKVKKFIKDLEKNDVVNVYWSINGDIFENDDLIDSILENFRFDYKTKNKFSEYFKEKGIHRPLHILQAIELCIEKKMIEEFADSYVLGKNANLKKLPPPLDYERMVKEILEGCDPLLIDILQCCAVIGRSFNVSIIAHIFNKDILELLHILKEGEAANIIRDIVAEDNVYEFIDKRMVGIFRNLKSSSYEDDHISQKVREYHKRFIFLKEKEAKEQGINSDQLPYRDILSLASHSQIIRDVYPEKSVHYNRIAAELTFKRGMFAVAGTYYKHALDTIKTDLIGISPEEAVALYISYGKCLLDEQADSDEVSISISSAFELIKTSLGIKNENWAIIELRLMETLQLFRLRKFSDAITKSLQVIDDDNATVLQKLRAKFYHAASIAPNEIKQRIDEHLKVLNKTDEMQKDSNINDSDRIEILKIRSEALNNIGFVYLYGLKEAETAVNFFKKAIKIKKLPAINDQKGIAIAHGGLGDSFKQLGQTEKAESAYLVNLGISRQNGDKQGIVRMTSVLGGIMLEKGKKSDGDAQVNYFKESEIYYTESLGVAEDQKNIVGIFFALSGLVETAMAAKTYERVKFVFRKLDEIYKKFDISKIPDFAMNTLKESLTMLAGELPEYDHQIGKYIN